MSSYPICIFFFMIILYKYNVFSANYKSFAIKRRTPAGCDDRFFLL